MGKNLISETIESKIYVIRGRRVMLDSDLAELYGVATKVLNQAVKRNRSRFPEDFMYQLNREEIVTLRSQIVTSKKGRGGSQYRPFAFTELGVAMLSSVLNSEKAIKVNIQIMRTFVKLREVMSLHKDLYKRIDDLERGFQKKFREHDESFKIIFEAIRKLLEAPLSEKKPKRKIGFHE